MANQQTKPEKPPFKRAEDGSVLWEENNITDYQSYSDFLTKNWPDQFTPSEGSAYDYENAYKARILPQWVPERNEWHMGSIGLGGLVLKSPNMQESFRLAEEEEKRRGSMFIAHGGRTWSVPSGFTYSPAEKEGYTPYQLGDNTVYRMRESDYWSKGVSSIDPKPPAVSAATPASVVASEEPQGPDRYKQLNTAAAGVNIIRNIGSIIREQFRKSPRTITPPNIVSPEFKDAVTPQTQEAYRQLDRTQASTLAYLREQGGSPNQAIAAGANAIEGKAAIAEQGIASAINQNNQQAQIDSNAQAANEQARYQAALADQQRRDTLAEKSEIVRSEAFQSIINSATGLATANLTKDQYDRSMAMQTYSTVASQYSYLMRVKAQMMESGDLMSAGNINDQLSKLSAQMDELSKSFQQPKASTFANITGFNTSRKGRT